MTNPHTKKPIINKPSTVKAVDGHGLSMKDYYFDRSTNNFELKSNPPEHVSSSELKIGSPEHRRLNPSLYKSGYVDWWERDDKLKEKVNSLTTSDLVNKTAKTKQETADIRKTVNDKIPIPTVKYFPPRNPKQEVREAAIEKLRVFAFAPRPNLDENKGIGFLMKTIAEKKPEEEI